jgi:hypothetical protein
MAIWFLRDNSPVGSVGGGTIGWSAVPKWTAGTATSVGTLRRQNAAPAVNSERVFVCVSVTGAATTGASEPAWVLTKGASTTDNLVTWRECTGNPGVNNARASVPASATMRSVNPGLGRIIKNDPGTHLYICNVAGTTNPTGTSPTLGTTIGGTTVDGGTTWICLAVISAYANWAAPHARIATAVASGWVAAGDDVYGASDHSETQASLLTINAVGTAALAVNVWCTPASDDLSNGPQSLTSDPYSQTPACAQMTTTAANGLTIANATYINFYGWVFNCGNGANVGTLQFIQRGRLERCSIRLPGTVTGSNVTMQSGDCIDCSFGTGHVGGQVRLTSAARCRWMAGTSPTVLNYSGMVIPTIFFGAGAGGEIIFDGLDLSNVNTTLIGSGTTVLRAIVSNCKTNSSVTYAVTPTDKVQTTEIINCDYSGGTQPYRQERWRYEGRVQIAPAYRTGGVTDGITGTPYSWLITTSANCRWLQPVESFPMAIWNTTVGVPVTVTIYANGQGVSPPANDEIWMEAEYFSDASTPLTIFANTTKASYLSANTNYPTDSSTWTGGSGPFTMSVTITPLQVGYIYVRIKAAKPNWQFLIDRKIYLS